MSDDSDDYDLNNICDEINQYEFGINKIRILKKNKFYDENVDEKELNQIDYLYTSCKINNPDLLNKIQICAEKKILDYSIIEQIIICAIGSSLATEIEKNLNEFYEFLLELEFKVNDTKIIREFRKDIRITIELIFLSVRFFCSVINIYFRLRFKKAVLSKNILAICRTKKHNKHI